MVAETTLLDDFINLLLERPAPERIMEFKATAEQDHRLESLIRKSQYEDLTINEQLEVEQALKASHYITLAKIKAYGELRSQVRA